MPRTSAKVLYTENAAGKLLIKLQCNCISPRVGDMVSLKWGPIRSKGQNSLYWSYLSFLIEDCGLKDHGHFSPEALHEDLKAFFLAEKKLSRGEFKAIDEATTTDLTTKEFSDYIEKVRQFVQEFFEINDEVFWISINP